MLILRTLACALSILSPAKDSCGCRSPEIQHEGKMYKAICDSKFFNNAALITNPHNVIGFFSCDLAIGLAGLP
jgi:hypothetical protein